MKKTAGPVLSSPAVQGDRVFIGSKDNYIYCYDIEDGTRVWEFRTDGAVFAPITIASGTVYAGSADGYMYALDTGEGSLRWKYRVDGNVYSSAAVNQILPWLSV